MTTATTNTLNTDNLEMVDWKNVETAKVYPAILRTDVEFTAEQLNHVNRVAYVGDSCLVFPVGNERVGMWFNITKVYVSVTREEAKKFVTVEKTPIADSFAVGDAIAKLAIKDKSKVFRTAVVAESVKGTATGFVRRNIDFKGTTLESHLNLSNQARFDYMKLVPIFGKGVHVTAKNCEGMTYQILEVATGKEFLVCGSIHGVTIVGKKGARSPELESILAKVIA